MIRLGLCCKFLKAPIHFRTTTVTHLKKFTRKERIDRIDGICLHNAQALLEAIKFCAKNGIGSFRVNSQILPVKTHPDVGYDVSDLPNAKKIIKRFKECGSFAKEQGIRLSFHPDQFIILNAQDSDIVERSIADLRYQAQVADWVGADVINIHGGGGYGEKTVSLKRLAKTIRHLPKAVRSRLTLENDDRVYTPKDLLPVCLETGIPFVYDVHHHRCFPDGLREDQVTCAALRTWDREPVFHISSPKEGWKGLKPFRHHDYIRLKDLPDCWKGLDITIDVEAKDKEAAVLRLKRQMKKAGWLP